MWLNSFKGSRTPIPPLLHDDSYVTEDLHKAEAFNAYFSSVFTVDDGSDISSYRDPYLFIHLSFNLLNLMLRRYALSWKVLILVKPVVQI